jgi:opacity protein-like surface antigen
MNTSPKSSRFTVRPALVAVGATAALFFAAVPAQAQGVPGIDFYVGAGVGQSSANVSNTVDDFDEKDFAWKGFVGLRALSYLGAELDYINFGKPTGDGDEFKYKGFAGFGLFYVPIPLPVLDVYVKAGLARVDVDVPSLAISEDDTKFAFGGGVQLKFGSLAVRAEYEQYKAEIAGFKGKPKLLSLGFSKSFL